MAVRLAVAYPLSYGPVIYASLRGWIPARLDPAAQTFYAPLANTFDHWPPPLADAFLRQLQWWQDRAAD